MNVLYYAHPILSDSDPKKKIYPLHYLQVTETIRFRTIA